MITCKMNAITNETNSVFLEHRISIVDRIFFYFPVISISLNVKGRQKLYRYNGITYGPVMLRK